MKEKIIKILRTFDSFFVGKENVGKIGWGVIFVIIISLFLTDIIYFSILFVSGLPDILFLRIVIGAPFYIIFTRKFATFYVDFKEYKEEDLKCY